MAQLEASAKSEDDKTALLYNLERGELLRMDRRYEDSTNAFLLADIKVKEWEETAKTNPSKLMGTVGAALISERPQELRRPGLRKGVAHHPPGHEPRGPGRL